MCKEWRCWIGVVEVVSAFTNKSRSVYVCVLIYMYVCVCVCVRACLFVSQFGIRRGVVMADISITCENGFARIGSAPRYRDGNVAPIPPLKQMHLHAHTHTLTLTHKRIFL